MDRKQQRKLFSHKHGVLMKELEDTSEDGIKNPVDRGQEPLSVPRMNDQVLLKELATFSQLDFRMSTVQ